MTENFPDDFTLDFRSIEETMLEPLWTRAKYSLLHSELFDDLHSELFDDLHSELFDDLHSFGLFFNVSYKN